MNIFSSDSKELFESFFTNTSLAVSIEKDNEVFVNQAFIELFSPFDPMEQKHNAEDFKDWFSTQCVSILHDFGTRYRLSGGQTIAIEKTSSTSGAITLYRECSPLFDHLAGSLLSQESMMHFLEMIHGLWLRYQHTYSILLFDIKHFSKIKSDYGDQSADFVLNRMGEIAFNQAREVDKVCRWNEDSFLILLPETPESQAHIFAERLAKSFSQEVYHFTKDHITAAIAVGEIKEGEELTDLMTRIHSHLTDSKQ